MHVSVCLSNSSKMKTMSPKWATNARPQWAICNIAIWLWRLVTLRCLCAPCALWVAANESGRLCELACGLCGTWRQLFKQIICFAAHLFAICLPMLLLDSCGTEKLARFFVYRFAYFVASFFLFLFPLLHVTSYNILCQRVSTHFIW